MWQVLITAGDLVDETDSAGDTTLHWAARGNHTKAATQLLASGATRDRRNSNGETALVAALHAHHKDMEALLAKAGANPHFRLHWAAQHGDTQVSGASMGMARPH